MEKYIGPDILITKLTTDQFFDLIQGWGKFTSRKSLNIPDSKCSNEGKIIYFYVISQIFYPFSSRLLEKIVIDNLDATERMAKTSRPWTFYCFHTPLFLCPYN
jgi:hypothetical protein